MSDEQAVVESPDVKSAVSTGEGQFDYVDPHDGMEVADLADVTPNNNADKSNLEDLQSPANNKPEKKAEATKESKKSPAKRQPKPKVFKQPADKKSEKPAKKAEPELGDPDETPGEEEVVDAGGGEAESGKNAPADKTEEAEDEPLSAELIALAKDYGFSKDEAERLGATALQDVITALDRRELKQLRDAQKPPEEEEQAKPPKAETPPAQKKEPAPTREETQKVLEKFKIDLDPRDFDEDTINLLNGLNDHYHGLLEASEKRSQEHTRVIQALIQDFSGILGRFKAEDTARFTQEMDEFFEGLGEEFRPIFGTGKMADLPDTEATAQARRSFVQEMNALGGLDQKRGRVSTTKDLRERALRLLYPDRIETKSRNKLAKQVEARRNSSISRPTARPAKSSNPDQAAVDFARRYYKDNEGDFADPDIEEL